MNCSSGFILPSSRSPTPSLHHIDLCSPLGGFLGGTYTHGDLRFSEVGVCLSIGVFVVLNLEGIYIPPPIA